MSMANYTTDEAWWNFNQPPEYFKGAKQEGNYWIVRAHPAAAFRACSPLVMPSADQALGLCQVGGQRKSPRLAAEPDRYTPEAHQKKILKAARNVVAAMDAEMDRIYL